MDVATSDATARSAARFEDLVAWQRARMLVREVHELFQDPEMAKRFAFRNQLERAAISVMSNIAEGHERGSRAEFPQMLTVARGSCGEVRSLLYVAMDAGFIDRQEFQRLRALAEEVSRVVAGLRRTVADQRDADRQGHRR